MNPCCSMLTILAMHFFNLAVKILEMISYSTLQQAIGLANMDILWNECHVSTINSDLETIELTMQHIPLFNDIPRFREK